jgi:sporulation protein YunB
MHFRYRRQFVLQKSGRLWIALAVLVVLGIFAFRYVDRNMAPVIISMAEARVRAMAVKAMNDAMRSIMTDPTKYTNLISYRQDDQGNIIMMQADTLRLNDIAVSTALTTQDNIAQIGAQGIGIPLGSVLGGQLLAGRGPNIYARIIPVGSVTTDYDSEYEDKGINQTRLKIFLNLHTTVRIVIPTQSRDVSVDNKVLVTECIIVGKVPNSYVNVLDPNQLDLNPDENGDNSPD